MTPKKDIVRKPIYTLLDGSPVPSMGKEFTPKESRFIYWYTNPGTEAFLNAGRAAVRAGYKPANAVMQGYLLLKKPRIAEKINIVLPSVKDELKSLIWRIVFLCRDRMFFDITDFYRPCKQTVKIKGKEIEVDSYKIIPLSELTYTQRMCIDGIDYKGPYSIPMYKLANRNKAFDLFLKCYKLLFPEKNSEEMNWKATAEIIRERVGSPVIVPRYGNPLKDAIEAP